MVTDRELRRLESLAKKRDVPVATVAYTLLRDALMEV
jgi:hypothetical protein